MGYTVKEEEEKREKKITRENIIAIVVIRLCSNIPHSIRII